MPLVNIKTMSKRIKNARANKLLWESHLKECYKYAMPEKETIDKHSAGEHKRNGLYDDTAMEALDRFAARTQSQITPSFSKWVKFKAGSEVPEEQVEKLEEYLEEATTVLFEHLDNSNFITQVMECYQDVAISTACLIVEEGDGIRSHLNFRSVSLSEIIPEKTRKENIGNIWRDIKTPIRDITTIWKKAKLGEKLTQILAKDEFAEVTLQEGVVYDEKLGKYVSMVISTEFKHILFEETLDTSPFIAFRESAVSGETLGRGRIMRKLPSIKLLNKIVEIYVKGGATAVSPVYTAVDDGIVNPDHFSFAPNSINTVESNDNTNPSIRALMTGGDPQLANLVIKDLQNSIKNFMLAEPFGQVDTQPQRTAFEMGIRDEESKEMRSASFGRIQSEFLEPLIARIVDILKKNGKIADFKVDGKEVKLQFMSPASKARDRDEVENLVEFAQVLQQTVPPEVLAQTIKFDEVPSGIADLMGIPKKYINSKAEIAQAQQAQQAQMRQMQQMEAEGEGMKAEAVATGQQGAENAQ